MTCLRIPTSLDDANALIVACSGQDDWRPLFVLGLEAMLVGVIVAVLLALVAWRLAR